MVYDHHSDCLHPLMVLHKDPQTSLQNQAKLVPRNTDDLSYGRLHLGSGSIRGGFSGQFLFRHRTLLCLRLYPPVIYFL